MDEFQNSGDLIGKKRTNLVIVLASLGSLLALSNWFVVQENHRLRGEVDSLEAFQHTPVGVKLPPLRGKGLDGQDVSISFPAGSQETLVFAFSPSCGHCKETWPAWLELARGCRSKRVVFANVGGQLSEFLKEHRVGDGVLLAHVDPASVLEYHFHATPITLLVTPDGWSKNVWRGEIPAARLEEVKKDVGWRQ
jgi:hypothetical protein